MACRQRSNRYETYQTGFQCKGLGLSPLGALRGGAKAKSEYGHVAYKIKADNAGSNMVANILATDTPSTPGVGSKGSNQYFSESSHVAYQIKADNAGSNMVANILATDTPLTPGVGSKGQTNIFLKVVMLHIKLKLTTLAATW